MGYYWISSGHEWDMMMVSQEVLEAIGIYLVYLHYPLYNYPLITMNDPITEYIPIIPSQVYMTGPLQTIV